MGICVSCRRRERKAPEKRSVPGAGPPAKGAAAAELLPPRLDRLPTMANSMSNIKMTNPIKGIVSKRRRRYMKDGFNLDLAYITDRLIAMGFPAEKLEGVYRNHIDEVYRFLEKMHKDHYKIYNLCSERAYDSSKFHERVVRYAFEDHTPPNIEMIQPFCEDVHNWLSADSKNVAAVHCKAGKGRTGTMVCCYLLYSRQKLTADEALKFYGTKRTHDEKGVTIPSQRRYVEYYASLLHSGLQYAPTKIHIRELVMTPPPFLHASHAAPELVITQAKPFFKTPMGCQEVRRAEGAVHVRLTHCTPLCGDVRVDVYNKPKMKMRKEKLFHFWFNTYFVAHPRTTTTHPPLPDSPNLEAFKLTLNKWQLDDAHKDKQHKHYSQDFKVELIVQKMPESSTFIAHGGCGGGGGGRAPSPPSSTASSCSEGDEPDAHWDSGERIPYCLLTHTDLCEHSEAPAPGDPERSVNSLLASEDSSMLLDSPVDSTIPPKDARDSPDSTLPSDDSPLLDSPIDSTIALNDPLVASKDVMLRNSAVPLKSPPGYGEDPPLKSPVKCSVKPQSPVKLKPPGDDASAPEPMEYYPSNAEVFSSRSSSARGSPVDECKAKRADDKSKPRLSLGDMRASWREFSGKFASDIRRRKEDT